MSDLLQTYSRFLYGFEVTNSNNMIDFDEGAGALAAEIDVGSYSLGRYLEKVAEALNLAGANTYTVTVNRSTRLVTITSDTAGVDFLFSTGANADASAASTLGFAATDLNNQTTITGSTAVGTLYDPQFWLQSYVPPENSKQAAFATKNKSASGKVKVQRFGTEQFMKCDIQYATDIPQTSAHSPIKNNASGLQDLRDFMDSMINQMPCEFYPDVDNSATYYTLILESTPESKDGTGFELKEMQNWKLRGYYATGRLVFRVTEE